MSDTKLLKGLSLTSGQSNTFASDTNLVDTLFDRSGNATFRVWANFPSTIANGCLFELGATGTGTFVGIIDSDTTPKFIVRAGDGAAPTTTTMAYLSVTDFPADDKEHEVIWDFNMTDSEVRLWIDGQLKGSATASAGMESGLWAGTDDGAVGRINGTVTTGATSSPWPTGASSVSSMDYYHDQLANTSVYPSITWRYSGGSNPAANNQTFSAVPIGDASAGRKVVVGYNSEGGAFGGLTAFESGRFANVIIGGVQAQIYEEVKYVDGLRVAGIAWADIPTGTTADITIRYLNQVMSGNGIEVWTVEGVRGVTDSASTSASSAAINLSTVTIDSQGAALLFSTHNLGSAITISGTGVTQDDSNNAPGGASLSIAAAHSTTTGTVTYTSTASGSAATAFVGIAFEPEYPTSLNVGVPARIADYSAVALNAATYNFPSNPSGNLTSGSIQSMIFEDALEVATTVGTPVFTGISILPAADSIQSASEVDTPEAISGDPVDIQSTSNIGTAPDIGQVHNLGTPDSIQSTSEVETTNITQTHNLGAATNIQSLTTVDTPEAISGDPVDIESDSEVGTPLVGQEHALGTPDSIQSLSEVDDNVPITQTHNLADADDIQSTSNIGTAPDIGQVHNLGTPDSIQSTSEVDTPEAISGDPVDIESDSEVGTPVFTGISVLPAADSIQSTSEVDTPEAISGDPVDIESDSEVGTPVFTGISILPAADSIQSASEVDTPEAISGDPVDIESDSEVGTTDIGQVHGLTADSIQSTSEVETTNITQTHILGTPTFVQSTSETGTPVLEQEHALGTPDSIQSLSSVDTPEAISGDPVDIESASEVGTPAVSEENALGTPNSIQSLSSVDDASITQIHDLSATGIQSISETGTPEAISGDPVDIESASEVGTPVFAGISVLPAADSIESASQVNNTVTFAQNHWLDPNIVPNGRFLGDASGWLSAGGATITWLSSEEMQVDSDFNGSSARRSVFVTTGKTYDLSGTARTTTGTVEGLLWGDSGVWSNSFFASTTPTTYEDTAVALDGFLTIDLWTIDGSSTLIWDDVYLTERLLATSTSETGTPTITQTHNLGAADSIQSASEVETTDITQNHILGAPTFIESTSDVGTPYAISGDPVDIESDSEVGTPVFTGISILPAVDSIESASEVNTPEAISGDPVDIESNSEVGTTDIGQVHNLGTPDSIQSLSEVETTNISQVHNLTATALQSLSEVPTPEAISGDPSDIESSSPVGTPDLGQVHALSLEYVQNGTFDSGSNWTLGTTWTISGGTANINSGANFEAVSQTLSNLVDGSWYTISVTVTSYTSGAVKVYLGNGGVAGDEVGTLDGVGTFTFLHQKRSGSNDDIIIRNENTITILSIDDVTVQHVILSTTELGVPGVGQNHNLTPDSLQSTSLVGTPEAISGDPVDIQSITETGTPVITQTHALGTPDSIQSTSEVETTNITQIHNLGAATAIQSTSETGTPYAISGDPSDIESAVQLGTPLLGQEHALGAATSISSTSEVGDPVLSESSFVILADSISSTSSVGSPAITQTHNATASPISSQPETGTPEAISGDPSDILSLSEVGTPLLTQNTIFTATSIESASEVGTPTAIQNSQFTAIFLEVATEVETTSIGGTSALIADNIESNSEIGAPYAISGDPSDIESASEVGSTSIDQTHNILADSIESITPLDTPEAISGDPSDIESAVELGAVNLFETNQLTATGIQSTSEVETTNIDQTHNLTATSLTTASETGSPEAISGDPSDVQSAPETGTPLLEQEHALGSATSLTTTSEVDNPSLSEVNQLNANGLESLTEVETTYLISGDPVDLDSGSEVGQPTFGQIHNLTANDLESASEVGLVTANEKIVLLASAIQSGSEVGSPATDPIYIFQPNNIESATEVEQESITQIHDLTALSIESLVELDTPPLFEGAVLDANSIESATEVDLADLYRQALEYRNSWNNPKDDVVLANDPKGSTTIRRINTTSPNAKDNPTSSVVPRQVIRKSVKIDG